MPLKTGRWWLTQDSHQVVINATPEHVYNLVADLPRMGQWSPECKCVEWADGWTAARIVEAAQQNFLETRHVAEISTIAEYIAILEGHATTLRASRGTVRSSCLIKGLRRFCCWRLRWRGR